MSEKNIYQKLTEARKKISDNEKVKPTGEIKFKNSTAPYWKLSDFQPAITAVNEEFKMCYVFDFDKEKGVYLITLFNNENPEEKIVTQEDFLEAQINSTQPIQSRGGTRSFMLRYLLKDLYAISDSFDTIEETAEEISPEQTAEELEKQKHEKYKESILKGLKQRIDDQKDRNEILKNVCIELDLFSFDTWQYNENPKRSEFTEQMKVELEKHNKNKKNKEEELGDDI